MLEPAVALDQVIDLLLNGLEFRLDSLVAWRRTKRILKLVVSQVLVARQLLACDVDQTGVERLKLYALILLQRPMVRHSTVKDVDRVACRHSAALDDLAQFRRVGLGPAGRELARLFGVLRHVRFIDERRVVLGTGAFLGAHDAVRRRLNGSESEPNERGRALASVSAHRFDGLPERL